MAVPEAKVDDRILPVGHADSSVARGGRLLWIVIVQAAARELARSPLGADMVAFGRR
jgi:hypothetical protein